MVVFVISNNGERLMPTSRLGRVRHLLKDGKAVIIKHQPFTIQLTYDTPCETQPIELCMDTGYQHIGLSLKSERQEYLSQQYDLLKDEKERHDSQRKYRRARRNRLRYRKPRFDNRAVPEGWVAPSLQHKADAHIRLLQQLCSIVPVTSITLEMGQFDTQLLAAIEEGTSIPEGVDYQHGDRYGVETLREAVFQRDKHTCIVCKRGIKDGAILHAHHLYFWRGQHGNRCKELGTVCELCHTAENHQPGGKLWGYDKPLLRYTGATFLNTVKWLIYHTVKATIDAEVHITYGVKTKLQRNDLRLSKSHVNDAYSMGELHPAKRAVEEYFQKRRRNNRVLEKFYDSKYMDIRDGKTKSGSQLGTQRIDRSESRCSAKSQQMYRGAKVKAGQRSIRRQRYSIQPGDVLLFQGRLYISKGIQNKGTYVSVDEHTPIATKKCKIIKHCGSWKVIPAHFPHAK